MAVINMLPSGGGISVDKYYPWVVTKNGGGSTTLMTSDVVTCSLATTEVIYSLAETTFSDSASSAAANGTVKLQGSNNNSTWSDVQTLSWTTGTTSANTSGITSGYKYYRFQFYANVTGSGWGKISAGCFIAYK